MILACIRPGKFIYLLAAFVFLLAACGRKTMPVPPQAVLPAPISDLRYELDDQGVTLIWSRPAKTVRGDREPALSGYVIEKGADRAEDYCPDCPKRLTAKFSIDRDETRFRDTDLTAGSWYFYRVSAKAGWHTTSDPSNMVALYRDIPAAAPVSLSAIAGESRVELSWQAPAGDRDGQPLAAGVRYQVYRSLDGRDYSALGSSLSEQRFVDTKVVNGTQYHYLVRALTEKEQTLISGAASKVVQATPKDLTPPPAPENLTVVSADGAITLHWDPVEATDLGGYRVYRQAGDSKKAGGPVLVSELGPGSHAFTDPAPPVGQPAWNYTVTAIDRAEPANESTRSKAFEYRKIQ